MSDDPSDNETGVPSGEDYGSKLPGHDPWARPGEDSPGNGGGDDSGAQPPPELVGGELRYACPCCGYRTLTEPTPSDEICHVCFWQDDLVDNQDTPVIGPNGVTLSEARANFAEFGAGERRTLQYVRPPLPEEGPPTPWTAPSR